MTSPDPGALPHLDGQGRAHMVDVGEKAVSAREAVAIAALVMRAETLDALERGAHAKGDALAVARVAGIMGAKRCADLIPLCHPLPLDHVSVEFGLEAPADPTLPARVWVRASARCTGRTGVEMEALCAANAAALTLYDMCKAVDRGMILSACFLASKSGGRSGRFEHPEVERIGPPAHLAWR